MVREKMACGRTTESKVGDFEHPAQDWKISASEDEENSRSHSDRCGTGVLPLWVVSTAFELPNVFASH
jgi:hypothetical protein